MQHQFDFALTPHFKKKQGSQTKVLNIYIDTMYEQINESYSLARSQ